MKFKHILPLLAGATALALHPSEAQTIESPLEVRVVVLVNFEVGAIEGDAPGEFQHWYTRGVSGDEKLELVPLPQSSFDAAIDRDRGVLVTYTGLTADRAAASVMAMGMDPRFDFSKAYWIIGGIAGIDPEDGAVGDAVWGEWVVNADWAHEIDPREMPEDWPTGYLPFKRSEPYAQPVGNDYGKVYHLNPTLRDWAYELTKDVELLDTPAMADLRNAYTEHPAARAKPVVKKGDNISASTFWHGKILNEWANQWVRYWTGDEAEFVTSAVEDSGILEAVRFLTAGGKADFDRVMLLRTGSNYTMQPPGLTAAENLDREMNGFGAMESSVEGLWRVGHVVAREISENWGKYEDSPF
ncbi:purine-nucleoside phosphorylase [Coraliomargarita parva]|uniref:purine-nucleoside phosphorylase n=1 Tax=Coraliomargarita parva TaxID=3014050 RepID=UPI0022B31906|nr:purine nucleoside permease [Coraliomargarita parva]